jgi:transposase
MNEREVAADLLEAGPPPRDLLADKGFNGAAFAAAQAARGTAVLVPPTRDQRRSMPTIMQKVIAEWRNRVEAAASTSSRCWTDASQRLSPSSPPTSPGSACRRASVRREQIR